MLQRNREGRLDQRIQTDACGVVISLGLRFLWHCLRKKKSDQTHGAAVRVVATEILIGLASQREYLSGKPGGRVGRHEECRRYCEIQTLSSGAGPTQGRRARVFVFASVLLTASLRSPLWQFFEQLHLLRGRGE